MRLAVSNMAWSKENDMAVYELMVKYGFEGLEILPTRLIPQNPYKHIGEIAVWRKSVSAGFGFQIASMQSIWYERTENLFGDEGERDALISYTEKALRFAAAAECGHLVFGCPKNRRLPNGKYAEDALPFFRTISDIAAMWNIRIGMEANPPIYHTNFINTTREAFDFIDMTERDNFMLNFDLGALIENGEDLNLLRGRVDKVSHVHISEPMLRPIKRRDEHKKLFRLLREENYQGFVSIEMGNGLTLAQLEEILDYVAEAARN